MFSLALQPARLRDLSVTQRVAFISFFGQLYFFVPVMTPYLRGEGLGMAQIAGLQTILLWSMLLMEVPTGVLADRLGHRRSYQIALGMTVFAEVWFAFSHTYPMFIVSQLIAGTGFAFASGSVDAYVYESLPPDERTRRMQQARGTIGAAVNLASLVAYATTAFVTADLTHGRMYLTLWMGIAGLSVGFLLSLTLRDPARPEGHAGPQSPASLVLLRQGWATIRHDRRLQRIVLLAIVTNAFGAHLLVFYQQDFLETGVSGRWFGLALGLGSAVAIFTQLHAWRLVPRFGTRGALAIATGVPGVLYLAMAANGHPAIAVALFIVQWGALQLSGPLFSGLYNERIPDGVRATALLLISGITTLYVGAMGILLGWLSERSMALTFGVMGAIILAGGGAAVLGFRAKRQPVPVDA
ncbi:MAG: MFS transporter [Thermomicrobiales bacterium]